MAKGSKQMKFVVSSFGLLFSLPSIHNRGMQTQPRLIYMGEGKKSVTATALQQHIKNINTALLSVTGPVKQYVHVNDRCHIKPTAHWSGSAENILKETNVPSLHPLVEGN